MRLIKSNKAKMGELKCADCMQVFKELADNSIDLIVTDPPYRTTPRGNAGSSGGMLQKEINKKGQVFKYNNIDIKTYAKECFRVLKDGSHFYLMCNHTNLQHFLNTCSDAGFHFIKSLIWDKGNKITGQYYMSQFEYILFFRKGRGIKINNCSTPDILRVVNKKTKDPEGNNYHDTEKPVELMEILISNSSKEGDLVFDPFCGIGAVQRACYRLKRRYLCCDIDQSYIDVANRLFKEEV